jgi:hypothetical protein
VPVTDDALRVTTVSPIPRHLSFLHVVHCSHPSDARSGASRIPTPTRLVSPRLSSWGSDTARLIVGVGSPVGERNRPHASAGDAAASSSAMRQASRMPSA